MEEINNQKKEITIDDVARMMANGLNEVKERFDNLETDIKAVKVDVEAVKSDTEDIKANLNKKVDRIDYNTLKYRVEKLEKKFA